MKKQSKRVAVIKNAHTKAEMKAVEQEFINHKGPFLTLQQALDLAKAHQEQQSREKIA